MPIEIRPEDVSAAEAFLATVLADQVPEGRFTDGTMLRDITIKALAVVSAQFRKEGNTIQSMQSLLRLRELAKSGNDPAVDDAADAILSNWFLYRQAGTFARGVADVFVTRRQDYTIARTSQFYYNRTTVFYPDSSTDLVIAAADLRPLTDATGAVVSYTFQLRVVAARAGESYNVAPASWAGTGGFSPFVIRVSNSTKFSGGENRQNTVDMIDQARSGIAVRNLINPRSIAATLPQRYATLRRPPLALGMGDPEMQRDVAMEFLGAPLHVGGHFDIYLELPVAGTSFTGVLGGVYNRPDGAANVFGDAGVADWTATNVEIGDVIRITAGLPSVPRDFVVQEIRPSELYTSERRPFPAAATGLSYYIYRPLFGPDVQILPPVSVNTTGFSAATVQNVAHMVLPPEPHYDIIDVVVQNPDPGDPAINAPDGKIHFLNRVNTTPVLSSTEVTGLPFQIIGRQPRNGQSARAFDELVLPVEYNGKQVKIEYQTLAGFSSIDLFTRDRFERILSANVQTKGLHPVYLTLAVPYSLSPRATASIDELKLRQGIMSYINSFDPRDIIDVSDITTFVKNYSSNIGTTYAFSIQYTLLAPDGNVYDFLTEDKVTLNPDNAFPENPITAERLLELTVSDRTVRYLTRLDRIQVEEIPG